MISRAEAKKLGKTRYHTGNPCPRGHVTERMVSNYKCVQCMRDKDAKDGRILARHKTYRDKNKEKRSEQLKIWKGENPDKVKAARVKYRHKNPEKWVHAARVRKGKIDAVDELKSGEWTAIKKHVNNKCLACGASPITMDHAVPLSKNGRHHVSNLQPLCGPCNNAKGTKDTDYRPDDWPWLPSSPRRSARASARPGVPEQGSPGGAAAGRGTGTPPAVGPCPHGVPSDEYCGWCVYLRMP